MESMPDEFVDSSAEASEELTMDSTFDWNMFEEGDYEEFTEPSYQPSRTKYVDLVHTKIEASFNWEESKMNGKATLTMKPHLNETDSVVLDAKGMEIIKVEFNGHGLSFNYEDGAHLTVYLGKTFKKDESFTIAITYIAKPEERETSGSDAITSDKGLYFINPK